MIIKTLSRAQMENITDHYPQTFRERLTPEGEANGQDGTTGLISIGNPGQSTGDVDEELFDGVLRLHFHDADPDVSHGTVAGMKLFDNGQARSVIKFIEDLDPTVLFIQCQAGESRSCGMAYALHQHYNDGELQDDWDLYNRAVHRKMKDVLRGFSKDSEYYNNLFS